MFSLKAPIQKNYSVSHYTKFQNEFCKKVREIHLGKRGGVFEKIQ
jgi:hypothetical protein